MSTGSDKNRVSETAEVGGTSIEHDKSTDC